MNVFYPLGIISQHQVTPYNNVPSDKFEDGSTQARLLWPAQNFKRQFDFTHENLTLAEYKYLRSFYSQRSGMYDTFWYRDNVNRKGNAQVRFSKPLVDQNDGVTFTIPVQLQEVAPIRALPEFDEVANAAGYTPVLWYDSNREFWLSHAGAVITQTTTWDAAAQKYPGAWTGGFDNASWICNQYNPYYFNSGNYAITAANIAEITAGRPAVTLFTIVNANAASAKGILCAVGSMGAGQALGIALAADNHFEPWIGGSETWTNARASNPGNIYLPDAWQSLCAVWTASSDSVSFYTNAALVGTDTNTRSLTPGRFSIGAAPDSSMRMAQCASCHFLLFAGALNLTQIKAVHNLLGYQFNLATVS